MVTQVQKTQTQTRTTKNSQHARLSAEPRSSINPVPCTTTTFGTSACVVTAFRPVGSGAESISTHKAQTPHTFRKVSEETENILDDREPTPLDYVKESQENPQDPPDPNLQDGGDGDEPDKPDNESPEPGERFLQVMSDLATGIRTLHQPCTKSRPKKVKVWEPNTFDGADPCKL